MAAIPSLPNKCSSSCLRAPCMPCIFMHPAALDQWDREVQLFVALRRLRVFRLHRSWKSFTSWKRSIRSTKTAAASAVLSRDLFMLNTSFQAHLAALHKLCYDLSSMRLHALEPGKVRMLHIMARMHGGWLCRFQYKQVYTVETLQHHTLLISALQYRCTHSRHLARATTKGLPNALCNCKISVQQHMA